MRFAPGMTVKFWLYTVGELVAPDRATVIVLSFSGLMQDAIVNVPSAGKVWRCVFSSDFSGYHESGTDSALQCISDPNSGETLVLPNLAPYSAAIYVCDE